MTCCSCEAVAGSSRIDQQGRIRLTAGIPTELQDLSVTACSKDSAPDDFNAVLVAPNVLYEPRVVMEMYAGYARFKAEAGRSLS